MKDFEDTHKLSTPGDLLERCRSEMKSARVPESGVLATIKDIYAKHGYLLDPHSAIGVGAVETLRKSGELNADGDDTKVVCLACAHWGKFPKAVGTAIGHDVLETIEKPELVSACMCLCECMCVCVCVYAYMWESADIYV